MRASKCRRGRMERMALSAAPVSAGRTPGPSPERTRKALRPQAPPDNSHANLRIGTMIREVKSGASCPLARSRSDPAPGRAGDAPQSAHPEVRLHVIGCCRLWIVAALARRRIQLLTRATAGRRQHDAPGVHAVAAVLGERAVDGDDFTDLHRVATPAAALQA